MIPRFLESATVFLAAALLGGSPIATDEPDFGIGTPPVKRPSAIRVATYNMENVFDHEDDPDLSGEHDDADEGLTEARASALADAIRAIDADILAIQEIESLDALQWFRDTYLADMGYEHAVSIDVGYYRGIEQGLLSRFPINEARVRLAVPIDDVERVGPGWDPVPATTSEPMTVQRSPLMVEIQVEDDYALTLFVMHHKSGRDFKWKREAEAVRNMEWIAQVWSEDPSRNILLLGDFNAAPWDKSVRIYLEQGFVDVMGFRTVSGEEGRRFKSHRSDRVIDLILANAPAYNEYLVGSAFILGTYNPPDSWDWRTDPHPDGYASDHYPVVIDLVPTNRN